MAEYFLRNEKKYLLENYKYVPLLNKLKEYVKEDDFKQSNILSVYYDSDDYRLTTRSIEKPMFKEKLRIRSYCPPLDDEEVFVELKKKFDGVVYKRRTKGIYKNVIEDIENCKFSDEQIGKEIKNLVKSYDGLKPKIFVSCSRTYFIGKEDKNLRITFDSDMKYRTDNVYLNYASNDMSINNGMVMEIKTVGAIPLWLSRILDELEIFPTSFSKVGTAFLNRKREEKYGLI